MIKKIALSLLAIGLLLTTSCFGKVSQNDLADLVGNVFGLQSMCMMMLMQGMPVENVTIDINEDGTNATVTYDNFVIKDLLLTMGASVEDTENFPLSTMSGTVFIEEDGSVEFDVQLTDAVIADLTFRFDSESQQILNLMADEKAYDINKTIQKMTEKQEQEMAAQEQEQQAALPQVQTVQ